MKISGITWITTYNCNYHCDHCFFQVKGPSRYMEPSMIEKVMDGFQLPGSIYWQHLSGGEIFLNTDQLFRIIQVIRKNFTGELGISTNGFWARSPEIAKDMLTRLYDMGVTGIAISADTYHQPFMDRVQVKSLLNEIEQNPFRNHSYLMGAVPSGQVLNSAQINENTSQLMSALQPKVPLPVALPEVRSIGKGSAINVPKKSGIPQGLCTELSTCLGKRSPFNPGMVWIDPYGNVMICYGIRIGNLNEKPLQVILDSYNPGNHICLKTLSREGPKGLFQLALDRGLNPREDYFDECDLCYQSRKVLRSDFPDIFTPLECYP